jgi:hypothetical protein
MGFLSATHHSYAQWTFLAFDLSYSAAALSQSWRALGPVYGSCKTVPWVVSSPMPSKVSIQGCWGVPASGVNATTKKAPRGRLAKMSSALSQPSALKPKNANGRRSMPAPGREPLRPPLNEGWRPYVVRL